MTDSLKAMASVCAWIVIFRTLLTILNRWLLWLFPTIWKVLFSGLLELSNGCLELSYIQNPAIKLIIAAIILCAGGLCVAVQTISVSPSVNHKTYYIGKAIQTAIIIPLSQIAAIIIYPLKFSLFYILVFGGSIAILIGYLIRFKRIKHQNGLLSVS